MIAECLYLAVKLYAPLDVPGQKTIPLAGQRIRGPEMSYFRTVQHPANQRLHGRMERMLVQFPERVTLRKLGEAGTSSSRISLRISSAVRSSLPAELFTA